MSPIIILPSESADEVTLCSLREGGFIPIVSDHPEKIVMPSVSPDVRHLTGATIMVSALVALDKPNPKGAFADELTRRVLELEKLKAQS